MKKKLIYLISAAVLTGAFYLLSGVKPLMNAIAGFTLKIRRGVAVICSYAGFSVAELLVCLGTGALIVWIIAGAVALVRSKRRLRTAARRMYYIVAAGAGIYFLLCLFLGASYYADSLQDKTGIRAQPASVEKLYEVTSFFADRLEDSFDTVPRDEMGVFCTPLTEIFAAADKIYAGAGEVFPFLAGPDVRPKPVLFSKLMSRFNYTGFYFPFTGEANINTDAPLCLMPATVAHEMAHQKGIASEQEANFAAVLACSLSGEPIYEYSGWLFGYIYLSNALYRHDRQSGAEISSRLPNEVKADLNTNNGYWDRNKTWFAEIGETVYDTFLKSYGQNDGVQSYGAVVDMLIAWYG